MLFIQEKPQGIVFKVFVQPRSSKNTMAGLYDDALKINLTAPPVDGTANKMCIKYLAKCLDIPKSSLEIISGHTGRTKYILVRHKTNGANSAAEKKRLRCLIESLLTYRV